MDYLPEALQPFAEYNQFILWKSVPLPTGKVDKLPVDHRTLQVFKKNGGWQDDPEAWTTVDNAITLAAMCGPEYGVGFFFTPNDPFYFIDIDHCWISETESWSPVANDVVARLPGAAVEVSQSGTGLHVFGMCAPVDHGCNNKALGLEMYTEKRFAALTGVNAVGNAAVDHTQYVNAVVDSYFGPGTPTTLVDWTSTPAPDAFPIESDELLIEKARGAKSAAGVFGGAATFDDLWTNNVDVLSQNYPDTTEANPYDRSQADAALIQHLAFWTGNNCERMLTLVKQSGLARDKWDNREGYYLERTIQRAVSMQDTFYTGGKVIDTVAADYGAPKLRASSDGQRDYANNIRAQKLLDCAGVEELIKSLCTSRGVNTTAKFWLDNQDKTPVELAAMLVTVESAASIMGDQSGPVISTGYQYLGATLQIEHFEGCVYVQDQHKVFTPVGDFLKSEQFNATYGGYVFQLDETGDKTTRKAWEAFTESQIVRYQKAQSSCFRPSLAPGELVKDDGRWLVNTYAPINTLRQQGDVTPFLNHLAKVLPVEGDRAILLAYMAAVVQYKGVKFQWCPLLQGAEGNGKTLFSRCVAFAVGDRHTHFPLAGEIAEKFNEWLFNKIFIGVEDVYVPEHKKEVIEVLKPMITNDRLAMRAMQNAQVMADNIANFILNTNHKDAIRKTINDRRFCIFYCAQQTIDDITRYGMNGDYFPKLYDWLKKQNGYAIVSDYLYSYDIPDQLNPATQCHRAPATSSTEEAVTASLGGLEQEILEAIDEGKPGFAGGWVSSYAVDRLLQINRATRAIPQNKRRELMQSLGYDWHPALNKGRVNNHVMFDGGKPRLFIKNGHLAINLQTPNEVVKAYEEAQGAPMHDKVIAAFGNK